MKVTLRIFDKLLRLQQKWYLRSKMTVLKVIAVFKATELSGIQKQVIGRVL